MFDLGWQEFLMGCRRFGVGRWPERHATHHAQFFASYAESQIHGARIYDLP